jgi:hypothetical protein
MRTNNGGVLAFSVVSNGFFFWLLADQGVNLGKLGNWALLHSKAALASLQ